MPNFFFEVNFYLFGLIAIASALAFVTRKSPVAAALWLVNTMFVLAVIYVMLDAEFIGVVQILIYTGAIMVVFLFVIMLLNLGDPDELSDIKGKWPKLLAGFMALVMLAQIMALGNWKAPEGLLLPESTTAASLRDLNAVSSVAEPLFRRNLLAFELTSILLLVAIIGAVVLGKKRSTLS